MSSSIPLGDLRREYDRIRPEVDEAVGRVLQRGWFVLGEEGEAFEAEWAEYCHVAHAVGVGNGTDAIQLALRAAGIGPGDEVILPALTAAFTALAISLAGAVPVFADIEPRRYTLDPKAFEAAIGPRTAAVIPVHLYGCPALTRSAPRRAPSFWSTLPWPHWPRWRWICFWARLTSGRGVCFARRGGACCGLVLRRS